MVVATSMRESFATMKPLKPGRVSAVTTPGKREARSKVRGCEVPTWGTGVVILSLLCCCGSLDLCVAARVYQVGSENGNGYIVCIHFFLIVPAVGLITLLVNFFLKFDESRDQGLRSGRAAGNVNINGQKFIDARNDVISLLERATA